MKSSTCFLVISLIFYWTLSSSAQSREDRKNIVFTQRSSKFIKATGWMQSPVSGKWVSHANFVGDVNGQATHDGFGFNWMQVVRFQFQNRTYFGLRIQFTDGHFKYPALHEGWIPNAGENMIIMPMEQYAKMLKSLDKIGSHTVIKNNAIGPNLFRDVTETDILNELTTEMYQKPEKFDPYSPGFEFFDSLTIDYVQDNGKNVVRFKPDISGALFDLTDVTKKVPAYFETDAASFKTLFLPLTAAEIAYADSINPIADPDIIKAKKAQAEAEAEVKGAAQRKKDAEEYERNREENRKAAAAYYIQDSINKEAAILAKITDFKTSDTLYGSAAKWMITVAPENVSWTVISSFNYNGSKKYLLYSHTDQAEIKGLIVDPSEYTKLKSTLDAHDGKDFDMQGASKVSWLAGENPAKNIIGALEGRVYFIPCLAVNVSRKKVQYKIQDSVWCGERHDLKGDGVRGGYYETDLAQFSKIVSLP